MQHGSSPTNLAAPVSQVACSGPSPHPRPPSPARGDSATGAAGRPRPVLFLVLAGLLALCYALPFYEWARLARANTLFSHLPLIPCIAAYLVWLQRRTFPSLGGGARWPAVPLAVVGLGLWVPVFAGGGLLPVSRVALQMLSFCLLLWSLGFLALGGSFLRRLAFPALFLLFMVPFPPAVENAIEVFLQRASAEVAFLFLKVADIPVLRQGLTFDMPGLSIQVAPECSGIRSSWVLLITSLLAGHLFLHSAWKRASLALLVIPLGIIRNGFRILVISWLCVYSDPSWIDSPLHHRGGPIFFVLSLIPFTLLLLWMIRTDRRAGRDTPPPASAPPS